MAPEEKEKASEVAPPEEPEAVPGDVPAAPTPEAPAPLPKAEPAEDWATRFKYLLAEFDNYRKRTERERETTQREATASFLRRLLPVYEAFLHAREAVDKLPVDDPLRKGLDLVHGEWEAIFRKEGFVPVAKTGDRFDASVHEAIADAPGGPNRPEGTVVDVVQQGYRFNGGLIRPAKVTVARAPPRRSKPPTPAKVAESAEAGSAAVAKDEDE